MNMFTIFFQKTNYVWHKNSYVHSIDFKPAEFENVTSYSELPIEFVNEIARQLQWGYTTDI